MSEYDAVLVRAKRDAEKYGWKLNPNQKIVDAIIKGLIDRKKEYGEYYCPCKVVTSNKKRDAENICMCKDVREGGRCICGLFVK